MSVKRTLYSALKVIGVFLDHILDIQVPGITGIEFAQSIQYGF